VATTKAGINMDAVALMGRTIIATAYRTASQDGLGCAKLVVFANAVEDNPFMAGAFHGVGEPECVVNVGVSGPGVVWRALQDVKGESFDVVAETVKRTAFRITRMGQLVANAASERLGVPFGIVDLSLAPTPAKGDSVARILEAMGLETCGTHGTTAALALLNDAVKKGGVMASGHVGGLSGAFIPVSEDEGMIAAVKAGALGLDKLEAMTCVCSVGLDMIAVPGDTSAETISAIIADEAAIGVINNKTTAVRVIPAPGKSEGDSVEFGGLLGSAPVMRVNNAKSDAFIARGGRIPAPIHSLRN
ncbi:MAG: PFL family protein, partial [Synergistaceae bacterium]|nr:PFL family protein [Synergistaceae bacterium]